MRVVFMGSPEFAVPCLRALAAAHEVALVVSQPDKPAGRGGQLTAPAVKAAALELGVPGIQPRSAKTGELRDALLSARRPGSRPSMGDAGARSPRSGRATPAPPTHRC